MTPDPYEAGPPEYQPDEEPGDDDAALFAAAAYEQAGWEAIEESYQAVTDWLETGKNPPWREAEDG